MRVENLVAVYKKYRSGDPITDQELSSAIEDLTPYVDFIHALGERFHLTWRELHSWLETLKAFREARKARNETLP